MDQGNDDRSESNNYNNLVELLTLIDIIDKTKRTQKGGPSLERVPKIWTILSDTWTLSGH